MIAERYPEIAQLPDEDKLTLMVELWQDVMDDSPSENPALAAFVEQLNEAHRRREEEVRSGQFQTIPSDQVFREISESLTTRRSA